MADKNKSARTNWLSIAIVAAVAIGAAAAIYVNRSGDGNGTSQTVAACPAHPERRDAVQAAATGHVAAMIAADSQPVSQLAFNGPDGAAMTLDDFTGKTLLVNLWATWCAPCRAEMPALDRLEQSLGSDEFQVVAVNIDTGPEHKARAFLDEVGVVALEFYRDETMGVFNDLKTRALALGLPVTLLVDGDGCLVANMNGPAEWDSDDAIALIETAMAH